MRALRGILFCLVLLPLTANAWWHEDWAFRKVIAVNTIPDEVTKPGEVLLVRLHVGNFAYFDDLAPAGADLRFVAGDDRTLLKHFIEHIDLSAAVAIIRVEWPTFSEPSRLYMYYGNPNASTTADEPGFYSRDVIAAFHFNELEPPVRGGSAHLTSLTGHYRASVGGLVGSGLGIEEEPVGIRVTKDLDPQQGFATSVWVNPERTDGVRQILSAANWRVLMNNGQLGIHVDGMTELTSSELSENRWQHLVVSLNQQRLTLALDGVVVGTAALRAFVPTREVVLGGGRADEEISYGFIGRVDELYVRTGDLSAEAIAAAAQVDRTDSQLLSYLDDESRDDSGTGYFGLLTGITESIRPEGWAIVLALLLIGLLSFEIILSKSLQLSLAERRDRRFLDQRNAAARSRLTRSDQDSGGPLGPLAQLQQAYETALARDAGQLIPEQTQDFIQATARVEAVRAAVESALVDINAQLNQRLSLVTMAVSGGPFLGLLGTVVGVMITFAAISAAGEVNVRTIAPGVAAALTTTVLGLLVAIPSLFGYNSVAGRISRRTTQLEVFADELMADFALLLAHGQTQPQESTVGSVVNGGLDTPNREQPHAA